MDISGAHIVSLFLRTFLYGVYITIFVHCLRWLLFVDEGWKFRPKINRLMLAIALLVFVLTTVNLYMWHLVAISAIQGRVSPDGRLIFASTALSRATALIIDAILIYRCWVVSFTSWRIAGFPFFLLLANFCLFITSFAYMTATGNFNSYLLGAFYSCNIAINIIATGVIIYQILSVTKRNSSSSDLIDVACILVECGLPYLFTNVLALAATFVTAKVFLLPTSCAVNSTMNGIAFNLILIRVGLSRANTQNSNVRWRSGTSLRFDVPMLEDEETK